jgi:hypothetical protein
MLVDKTFVFDDIFSAAIIKLFCCNLLIAGPLFTHSRTGLINPMIKDGNTMRAWVSIHKNKSKFYLMNELDTNCE